MPTDNRKPLTPDDLNMINAAGTTWVPKNPRELLLPYISDEDNEDKNDLDKRKQKAKEVSDNYTKIINECNELEKEISDRCKDVKVPLNRQQHLRVMEAIGRVFGRQYTEITFEMYKLCIQELAKIGNDIPSPENL